MPSITTTRNKDTVYRIVRSVVADLEHSPNDPDISIIFEEIELQLLVRVKKDYVLKSKGGTDSAGIKWEPTNRKNPIMIDTGRLLDSIRVEVEENIIRITADTEYAEHALGRRPAWPDKFPPDYMAIVKTVVAQGIKKVVEKRLKQL